MELAPIAEAPPSFAHLLRAKINKILKSTKKNSQKLLTKFSKHKDFSNPEYTINGKLGDRKGVESENGIKSAFRKAKQQGCKGGGS